MLESMVRRMGERLKGVPPVRYVYELVRLLLHEGIHSTGKAVKRKLHVLRLAVVRPRDRRDLAAILDRHRDQPIIVYPPVLNWHIPLFQRPQQLAYALARKGFLYFYGTDNCLFDDVKGFEQLAENLYLTNRVSLLLKQPDRKIFHLYSTDYLTTAEWVVQEIDRGNLVVYEYIDEIDEKIAGRSIPRYTYQKHRMILEDERCIVVATADRLYQEVLRYRSRNCALVTNGVELEHFVRYRRREHVPDKLRPAITAGRPVIGYMGAFASWFDYELIVKVATERPHYSIVLIGWDYDRTMEQYRLNDLPNVHCLGPVPYQRLPEFACWFDVATIPFLLNDITESTSPVKLFEYMAMGNPIVTTALPECRKYRSVLIGEDHDDFLAKIDYALTLRDDEAYKALLKEEALANTWDSKAAQILELIQKVHGDL